MRPSTTEELFGWLEAQRERLRLPLLTAAVTGCPDPEDILKSPLIPEESKPHLLVLLEWQSLVLVLYLGLAGSKSPNKTRWRENVIHSLSYRVLTGLKASIDLASSGLELQHFQIARIVAEDTQCLTLALLSDEFCEEFKAGNTPEMANKVWHSSMSRGRLRKRIEKELSIVVPDIDIKNNSEYRKSEELIFGCFVHPSYISGMMHKFMEGDGQVGLLPWFRDAPTILGTRPYTFMHEGFSELTYALQFRSGFLKTLSRRKIFDEVLSPARAYLTKSVPYTYGLLGAGYFAGYIADDLWPTSTAGKGGKG